MNTSVLDATDMSCFMNGSNLMLFLNNRTILSFDYRRQRKMHEGMSKSVRKGGLLVYCVHSKILCFSIYCYEQ